MTPDMIERVELEIRDGPNWGRGFGNEACFITGDIGTGKSFIANATTHGLGAQQPLTAWQRSALRSTRLEVVINDEPLVIERGASGPDSLVRVTEAGKVTLYSPPEWSDRALDMLGFTRGARTAAALRRRAPKPPALTHLFCWVLKLDQAVIDQPPGALSIERQLMTRIQALLDVALRLDAGRLNQLEAERSRYAARRDECLGKAASTREVVDASRWAGYTGDELRIVCAERRADVKVLRVRVGEFDRDIEQTERQQLAVYAAWDRADERRQAANARLGEIAERLEEIENELENLHRPPAEDDCTDCAKCGRPLAGLPRTRDACRLCGRDDAPRRPAGPPPEDRRRRLIAERKSLRRERRAWDQRRLQWDAEAKLQFDSYRRLGWELRGLEKQRGEVSVELARAEAELSGIEEVVTAHERRERNLADAAAASADERRLEHAVRAEQERLKEGRERHALLTPLYQKVLYTLNLSETDHDRDYIDLEDHSFTFAGQPLSAHGAGGTVSIARIARLLTLIRYTHEWPDSSLLPGIGFVDTPRKDYGTDRRSAFRSEGLFKALRSTMGARRSESSLQLFVFDGSVSARKAHGIRRIVLDEPLTTWRPS